MAEVRETNYRREWRNMLYGNGNLAQVPYRRAASPVTGIKYRIDLSYPHLAAWNRRYWLDWCLMINGEWPDHLPAEL